MTAITIDLTSAIPVYEQIRSQVAGLVAVGTLVRGERLPASRDLARDLGIAVGTVQRAYRELEATGVVESRRRTGTVVAGPVDSPGGTGSDRPSALITLARRLVDQARAEELDDDAVLDLMRGVLREPLGE